MEDNFSPPKFSHDIPVAPAKLVKIGNFRLGKTIGVGSFGKVKIAEHVVTGYKVAVKILNRKKIKSLRMDLKIRREITNMKLFRHPHIIRLYDVIETPTEIFMVMEYVPGGELFDYIVANGKLSEADARTFFQQIISGVEYCHSLRVVHRDLKPENLLINTRNHCVKIADFGLSTMMQDGDFLKTSCGSPNYAAPEVISGRLYAGPEVDVWSCGVILYTLLCARLPFDDEYIPTLFKKIRAGVFEMPQHVSPECRDLLSAMLVVDPLKRITISEIRKHPWFQKFLPDYLKSPPNVSNKLNENLDEDILDAIVLKYAVDRDTVLEALQSGDVNELVIAYHLIRDNESKLSVDRPPSTFNPALFASSPPLNLREEIPFDIEEELVSENVFSNSNLVFSENKRKMWYLGVLSSLPPEDIMREVFRALREVGFEWKIVNPFAVRCRFPTSGKFVKIALQLYKVKEKRYLLDVKKIEGETFPFFDLWAKLEDELSL